MSACRVLYFVFLFNFGIQIMNGFFRNIQIMNCNAYYEYVFA